MTSDDPPPQDPVDPILRARLASVLPAPHRFSIFHVSTPPTKTAALCSAPPGERPDRTYEEKHFLAVAIDVDSSDPQPSAEAAAAAAAATETETATPEGARPSQPGSSSSSSTNSVLAFAIEVFLYSTAHFTTLFVSKADSTGYLQRLGLPRGSPSPIREVCAAFIAHLVDSRRRPGVQFVVSLFARAQAQYLFPGSVDCPGKHVLDDRGLIRWWCRVLNPLVEAPPQGAAAHFSPWRDVRAYLVIPGLDAHETRAFIPRSAVASSWALTHPLERISHYVREFDWVPPRCLIPRYPDDPTSRFRDELDEEAARSGAMQTTGSWKSVKTLDVFWDMMAFRQECSSGRMTGFIWVVFDDRPDEEETAAPSDPALPTPEASFKESSQTTPQTPTKQKHSATTAPSTTPRKLFPSKTDPEPFSSSRPDKSSKGHKKRPKRKLKGPVTARRARVKTQRRNYLLRRPAATPYYAWPAAGRGQRIVAEADYKRVAELLLHLDFATLDKAVRSTRRWVGETGMGRPWGYQVRGTRTAAPEAGANGTMNGGGAVNDISGLLKRKQPHGEETEQGSAKVNVLGAGLVKKKAKDEPAAAANAAPPVNVLGAGLVRKKPKA